MNPLVTIDRWLIEKVFEPFAFRFEALTGINNYTLARYILVIWPAALGAYALGEPTHKIANFAGAAIMLGTSTVEYFALQQQERMSRSGLANFERYGLIWVGFRWLWNTLLVVAWLQPSTIYAIGLTAYWLQAYLRACNRMPPSFKEEWDASKRSRPVTSSARH